MAGIITNVDSDVQKLRKLKNEIEEVKKALKGINIKVDVDIAKGMEAQLKSLTDQYNALVMKVAEAEGKIMLSTKRINDASEKIIQAQEKVSKAAGIPTNTGNTNSQGVNAAETASVQSQAKAYQDLKAEINGILGTREANVKRMVDEMNAIRLINVEIKKITKSQGESSSLSSAQQKRLEQLNNSLLTHKTALSEVRQTLSNNVKLDNVAVTSMNGLSQSLSRMRIAYRELTEEERKSPIGKELLASINQADIKIKELDATLGNHQRNVGNYSKQWNGLSMSIQQVGRELPSLAYGPKVFFSAISNNLPILADEIKRARIEYDLLKKSGQSATPVWKQITSSLFSWQSALTVGITLLTLYGDKVVDWVAGLFKAKDAIKELLSAEQEMALARKTAVSNSLKERSELDLLYKKLKDTTILTQERNAAISEWMKKYPQHSNIMNGELVSLGKLGSAYQSLSKQIVESAKARAYADKITELEAKKDDTLTKRQNQYVTYLKAIEEKNKAEDEYKQKEKNGFGTATAKIAAKDKIFRAEQNVIDQKKAWEDLIKETKAYDESISIILKKIKVDDLFPQPKEGTYDYWMQQVQIADTALKQIKDEYLKVLKSGDKEKIKFIPEDVRNQYAGATKLKDQAEKALNIYGDSSSKQEDQAKKLRKEQEKYKLLMDKQNREEERMEIDDQHEKEQIEINGLQEGSEKVLRQRKLNHEKELEAIKRESEDKKLQEIEKARSAFEAKPDNKGKSFDVDKFVKSEPVKKQFTSFDKIADAKTKTENTKYNRGDDLSDLLNQYQDYTDKRLAIETKFNKDIATLQEQRKQAVKNGDTEQVGQIDRSIAQATKNKGMELMGLDYDKLKESPEYVRAFENLKETSSETLNSLLTQLKKAKSTAAKVLSPDQLREYTSTIQSIMDELDSRNPFQSLSDKKKELAEAEEELANAQIELENAKQTQEAVKGGAKIENGISSSKFNPKTGKIDSTKAYLTEAQALDKVKDKTDKYNKSKDKVVATDAKVKKAEKDVKNQIDDLFNAMDDLGKSVGGQAGEIISLISDIGSFTMFAMEGVKAAADTSANAISTVEKASVILSIISAAVQVATKIAKLFKGESDEEKRKKQIDFYNQIISIYDKIIEKQKESIKFGYGFSSIEAAKNAMEDLNKRTEYYRKIANTSSKIVIGDKSFQYIKAMKELGVDVKEAVLGISTTDELSQLSAKQLEYIRNNYKDLWASLKDEQRDALQAIIDAEEKSKEIVDEWKESITGVSYDSFYTEFIDTLSDMDSSAEDMANNFGDYLRKSILAAMVAKEFQKDIDNLYEMWVAAGDEKSDKGIEITEDEARKIQEKQKKLTEAMIKRREEMEKTYGWDSSSSSQESTKKDFATASQDSIDELNGRFTAGQIAWEETKNQNILQSQSLNILTVKADSILSINTDTRNIADEIRTIQANSFLELQGIRENTGAIIKPIKDMAADIAEVKKNTSKL